MTLTDTRGVSQDRTDTRPDVRSAGRAVRLTVAAGGGPRVRALVAGDEEAVRRVFRDTVCLGRPLPFVVPEWDAYESLCLDWYLGPGGNDGAVVMDGDAITGYALVCTDAVGHRRWQRHHAALFSARVSTRLVTGGLDGDAARFVRLRLRDGWDTWRHGIVPPLPAHAHINLAGPARAAGAGRLLADHIDRRCRGAGLPGWFGEMNAVAGHRAKALSRLGGTVVHEVPNHTLSWLLGQPVVRLTVARWLPSGAAESTAVVA